MKIGMCGVGGMGKDFLKLFGLHPSVESVAIADTDAGVRAQAHEHAAVSHAFATLDELLALDLDAIAIFTPPWVHADQAVRSMKAGKHVICACPVGLTLAELHAVVDAVAATGKIYMIAETSYYRPAAMYARQAWHDGRFGDFVYGEGEYYYRPHAYPFWMRDYYGNMPPMLYPTHSTARVVGVTLKRIERVTCIGVPGLHRDVVPLRRRAEWEANQVSNMTMLGQMSGGGACRINEMRNVGCFGELGSILGTLGSIREHSGGAVWTNGFYDERSQGIDLTALWRDPASHPQRALAARLPSTYVGQGMGHGGSHRFLADEFVRAVISNRRPHNHVWLAVKYCAPGIVAWESLKRKGDWLEVPDFGEPTDPREPLEY